MQFEKITIIGLGLIGGSLAKGLKQSGQVSIVAGIDTDEASIKYAFDNKIIDEGSSEINDVLSGSEIVVISTHIGIIADTAKAVFRFATEDTIVTDTGSVKLSIVKSIEPEVPETMHFVAGHPIAGTENSGIHSADSALFKNRRCILTPTGKTGNDAISKVKAMWELAGSEVYEMDAQTHDHIFGIVSHLPHVVAYSLMNSVLGADDAGELLDFAGGGLKDYTRVSASSPEMWVDIFKANKNQLLQAISKFKDSLQKIESTIENNDTEGLMKELQKAAKAKRSL